MRCLYCDLDGTLLGSDGSLLRDSEGAFTLLGVRALEACFRAGVEVVFVTGRRRAQVGEDARLLGQTSYVFEAGAGVVMDGEVTWMTAPYVPTAERTVAQLIEESGAPRLLLERFPGRLEYHEPWHRDREVSHLLRGQVDAFAVDALLAEHGYGDLRLVDNGAVRRRSPDLAALDVVHAYHLVPRAASKAGAVERHRRARGYAREETIGVGDSREDLGMAPAVGRFWLVANGLEKDPSVREALAAAPNARVTEGRAGEGVYEAVITTLAGAA